MNGKENELRRQAERLAARPYEVKYKEDKLSDGSTTFMAYHTELPGCQSDGTTHEEAEKNLRDARFVYIYYLLIDGLDVPAPRRVINFKLDSVEHASSSYTSSPVRFSREVGRYLRGRNVLEQVKERTSPY